MAERRACLRGRRACCIMWHGSAMLHSSGPLRRCGRGGPLRCGQRCVIMSADDYMDASQRLLGLPLNRTQQREIVRVLVDCCAQEKTFNPFYGLCLGKLCESSQAFQFTLKFCFWDTFKQLHECSERKISNLAQLLAQLFLLSAQSMAMLKALDWTKLRARSLLFVRIMLISFVCTASDSASIRSCIQRLSLSQDGSDIVCDGLQVFLKRHMTAKVLAQLSPAQQRICSLRIKDVKKALRGTQAHV